LLLSDILHFTKGETVRLALLSAHYRQPLDWTDALVMQSKAKLDRWYGLLRGADAAGGTIAPAVQAALEDDLNTPQAFAALDALANTRDFKALKASAALMGLLQDDPDGWFQRMPAEKIRDGLKDINVKIDARNAAKKTRDFVTADRIRDELKARGIVLEDTANGTIWKRV
jgi:cysteinyl-tRNA synthetase